MASFRNYIENRKKFVETLGDDLFQLHINWI